MTPNEIKVLKRMQQQPNRTWTAVALAEEFLEYHESRSGSSHVSAALYSLGRRELTTILHVGRGKRGNKVNVWGITAFGIKHV